MERAIDTRPPWHRERPWRNRPCRRCYACGLSEPFETRALVAYPACPVCLGSGVEPPEGIPEHLARVNPAQGATGADTVDCRDSRRR